MYVYTPPVIAKNGATDPDCSCLIAKLRPDAEIVVATVRSTLETLESWLLTPREFKKKSTDSRSNCGVATSQIRVAH
jgi:hypothetical protein